MRTHLLSQPGAAAAVAAETKVDWRPHFGQQRRKSPRPCGRAGACCPRTSSDARQDAVVFCLLKARPPFRRQVRSLATSFPRGKVARQALPRRWCTSISYRLGEGACACGGKTGQQQQGSTRTQSAGGSQRMHDHPCSWRCRTMRHACMHKHGDWSHRSLGHDYGRCRLPGPATDARSAQRHPLHLHAGGLSCRALQDDRLGNCCVTLSQHAALRCASHVGRHDGPRWNSNS